MAVRMQHPNGGEARLTVTVDTAQTVTVDGDVYPLVTSVLIENGTPGRVTGQWRSAPADVSSHVLQPGETAEQKIPKPRRVALSEYRASVSLER